MTNEGTITCDLVLIQAKNEKEIELKRKEDPAQIKTKDWNETEWNNEPFLLNLLRTVA